MRALTSALAMGNRTMIYRRLRALAIAASMAVIALVASGGLAQAQYVACPPPLDLAKTPLPEIVTNGKGVTRGQVVLRDTQEALPASGTNCVPQLMRFYQNSEAAPAPGALKVPQPGPTIRARLGDIVELTFLNQIDPLDYGASIDQAEKGNGCDSSTSGYPTLTKPGVTPAIVDTMPNCFHGSSTGNLHFHGTHTTPTSTGDNVFIGVRPSPREGGKPVVTAATYATQYQTFFSQCEKTLKANPTAVPAVWNQMPVAWTTGTQANPPSQKTLLQAYDLRMKAVNPNAEALWPTDQAQINQGLWPQYYIGSFPYCFLLPKFPGSDGSLHMGQAPGTQWYHAHKHGSTALNVSNGMAGALIVEGDEYDGQLNKVYNQYRINKTTDWTRQQPTLVVNQLGSTPSLERGGAGGQGAFSVNGAPLPTMTMYPGEVKLWRIVNASSGQGFYLSSLPAGFTWQQIAQDGVQFDDQNYQARAGRPVFVAAGNRVDILVQAPSAASASPVTIAVQAGNSQAAAVGGAAVPLFTVTLAGSGPAMPMLPHAPPRPGFLKDIAASEVPAGPTYHRTLVFNSSGGGGTREHTIGTQLSPYNGTKFNPDTPYNIGPLNSVEEWTIYNTTVKPGKLDHPFHIHINPFQVIAVFSPNAPLTDAAGVVVNNTAGAALPRYVVKPATPTQPQYQCVLDPDVPSTWVPCTLPVPPPQSGKPAPPVATTNIWWDVFPIPAGVTGTKADKSTVTIPGFFTMRSRFVDYAGAYVLHCHILAHEDRGMMMAVEVGTGVGAKLYQHH